jgi:DNA-binding beta-propeller fold protein YncE
LTGLFVVGSGTSNGFTCKAATCGPSVAGSGNGQFGRPVGVAVNNAGSYVYITDSGLNRVEKFVRGVGFVGWAGGCGMVSGSNCVIWPNDGYTCAFSGIFWSCSQVTTGGTPPPPVQGTSNGFTCTTATCAPVPTPGGTYNQSNGSGQFNGPTGVVVDSNGNVYVTDAGNYRVERFGNINCVGGICTTG